MKYILLFAVAIGTLTLLTGCGGGDDDPNAGLPISPIASPSVSRYVGDYASRVTLSDGRIGAVAITVGADNRATGTLTVTEGTRSRQTTSFSFGAGTYAISGTVDPTTGAFTMSGNVGGQPFSYSGTLPTPGNGNVGGSYTLTAGGQTYTGSFGNTGVTPTPTPSSSPSPGGGTAGATSLTFSNVSSTDVDVSPITTANLKADLTDAKLFFNYDGVESSINATVASSVGASTLNVRTLTLVLSNTGFPTGSAFDVTEPGTIATKAVAVFSQIELSPYKSVSYGAKSGRIVVVSRSATTMTLRLENVAFAADAINSDNVTTGSFTVNGEFTSALTIPYPP